jgi:hypothetical protein
MSAHTQPPTLPLHIDLDAEFLRRTVEIEIDDGEVRLFDRTDDLDGGDLGRLDCIAFPTLDDAERVALRLLAAVRAARGRV